MVKEVEEDGVCGWKWRRRWRRMRWRDLWWRKWRWWVVVMAGQRAVFAVVLVGCWSKEEERKIIKERERKEELYNGKFWRYYNYTLPPKWNTRFI